ncbi:hypothetical protein J0S82_012242 [Galemys pyrenaicus]|uniref:Uncharacterized protein n=1 Tax=Galemys pyrenaicus TaxID=202257 RepID=A0A8J6AXJ9_GALPY|nr:hypothetical protein J0S82_012242 [Galemys pyrenaicus]
MKIKFLEELYPFLCPSRNLRMNFWRLLPMQKQAHAGW